MEEVYAVVFMDAIHYHVRSEGRIVKRAVYIALGIDMNGKKMFLECMLRKRKCQVLAFYHEWIKNRGVEDILIACVDGLKWISTVIEAVYPKQRFSSVSSIRSVIQRSLFHTKTSKN